MVANRDQSAITPTSTSKKRDRDDSSSVGSAEEEAMLSPSVRKASNADSKNARGDQAVTARNQPDDTPSRIKHADKKRVQRKNRETMDLTGDEYNSPPTTPTSSASKVQRKQKARIQEAQDTSTVVTPLKTASPKPQLDMTPIPSIKKQAAEGEGVRGPVHTRHITPKKRVKKGKSKTSGEQEGSSDPSPDLPSFGKDYQLQFKSIEEAQPEPRLGIVIPQEDDVEEVERNASSWVKIILQALIDPAQAPYRESKHHDETKWKQSLASHQMQVNSWVASNVRESERRAWLLLGQVISLQKEGVTSDTKGRTDNDSMFKANFRYQKILCSERLERIVAVIKEYSIIALDVLQLNRTDLFVAVPDYVARTKHIYLDNNSRRAKTYKEGRQKMKEKETTSTEETPQTTEPSTTRSNNGRPLEAEEQDGEAHGQEQEEEQEEEASAADPSRMASPLVTPADLARIVNELKRENIPSAYHIEPEILAQLYAKYVSEPPSKEALPDSMNEFWKLVNEHGPFPEITGVVDRMCLPA